MKQLLFHMQLIIGKKTRELERFKDVHNNSEDYAVQYAILECEIEDAKRVLAIVNGELASDEDKLNALKVIYETTSSNSVYDALSSVVGDVSYKIRTKMNLTAYSKKSVDTFIKMAVGKPFKDSEGEVIGKIVEVNRTEDKKVLELIVEIIMEGGESIEG